MHEERACSDHTVNMTASAVGPQAYDSLYESCPASVPQVRKDITIILATWRLDEVAFAAELVVTELFTNAVKHGRGNPRVSVCRKTSGIEISVTDRSAGLPRLCAADSNDEQGRGLSIVNSLSVSWGVSPARGGKRVWALLPV